MIFTAVSLILRKPSIFAFFLSLLFVSSSVNAGGFYYWDANGSDPGSGGPAPNGTWGSDAFWNENGAGTDPTKAYDAGGVTVGFSAGSDATSDYTITVLDTQIVDDMHFDEGSVTLEGGTLAFNNADARLVSAFTGITATINSTLTERNLGGLGRLTKYKTGTLVFGGSNTFACPLMIEGGSVRLGTSNVLADAAGLILGNGDTRENDGFVDTPATFDSNGYSDQIGTLKLTGPNPQIHRTIDFGHGASALSFADSDAQDWEGVPLYLTNYTAGADSLRVGVDGSGFDTQLALIRFADFTNAPAAIDNNGFITPIFDFAPVLLSVSGGGTSSVTITWRAFATRVYELTYKDNLSDLEWSVISQTTANGSTASLTDSSPNPAHRFYRVTLIP